MSFEKAKVTIDLAEYNFLLEKTAEKEKDLDYNEAYSLLLSAMMELSMKNAMGRINDVLEHLNRTQEKYTYAYNQGVNYNHHQFNVRLSTLYKNKNLING